MNPTRNTTIGELLDYAQKASGNELMGICIYHNGLIRIVNRFGLDEIVVMRAPDAGRDDSAQPSIPANAS